MISFESTLVIPAVTPDTDPQMSSKPPAILDLIIPRASTNGVWYFFPYWCCSPVMDLVDNRTRPEEKWPPLVKALLSIEVQGEGKWDFGIVEWRNIIIEAQTSETDLCTEIPDKKDDFRMQRTQPIATVNDNTNSTTCYIAYITFLGLN
ncbi:hypothetical protein DL95DRAFT_400819 [Leptodontidium sp. 2 PMI_412]|nr:hypothetical protein DL95DRAFT_400819 [Leptodontidium sp. 2 PMI_412]